MLVCNVLIFCFALVFCKRICNPIICTSFYCHCSSVAGCQTEGWREREGVRGTGRDLEEGCEGEERR